MFSPAQIPGPLRGPMNATAWMGENVPDELPA
jgi:hypothetical protein